MCNFFSTWHCIIQSEHHVIVNSFYVSCYEKGKIFLIRLGHIIGPRVDYCVHQPRNFGQIRQRDHFGWVNSNRPRPYIRFHGPESSPTSVCSLCLNWLSWSWRLFWLALIKLRWVSSLWVSLKSFIRIQMILFSSMEVFEFCEKPRTTFTIL